MAGSPGEQWFVSDQSEFPPVWESETRYPRANHWAN